MKKILLLLLSVGLCQSVFAQSVTMQSLLTEMIDRDQLARYPSPAYQCIQASSYERKSKTPDDIKNWFANSDRNYFLREDDHDGRLEYVLCDQKGPGAVVRIWMTWSWKTDDRNGILRFYFDDAKTPQIQGPINEIIDEGILVGSPLAYSVSEKTTYHKRGHNFYLPLPFARNCKITYEHPGKLNRGGHGTVSIYYHINFRTYADDVNVQTFSMKDLKVHADTIKQVQQQLSNPAQESDRNEQNISEKPFELLPVQSRDFVLSGPQAISQLALTLSAENLSQALRSTILRMSFDGIKTVWCPVGNFFGTGNYPAEYVTWQNQMTSANKMTSRWIMPFAKTCQITLENLGDQPVQISDLHIAHHPWQWDDRSMYFHANWNPTFDLETFSNEGAPNGAIDYNFIAINGQGVYVGDSLCLYNNLAKWWGEGDEKIYVDGETFPSHFGTGSEDYYGYAWCLPQLFSMPFHTQSVGRGDLQIGPVVNSRYRMLDVIPFTKSLQFDMEVWHWGRTKLDYAPTTFWYALPGGTCNVKPMPDSAKVTVKQ